MFFRNYELWKLTCNIGVKLNKKEQIDTSLAKINKWDGPVEAYCLMWSSPCNMLQYTVCMCVFVGWGVWERQKSSVCNVWVIVFMKKEVCVWPLYYPMNSWRIYKGTSMLRHRHALEPTVYTVWTRPPPPLYSPMVILECGIEEFASVLSRCW